MKTNLIFSTLVALILVCNFGTPFLTTSQAKKMERYVITKYDGRTQAKTWNSDMITKYGGTCVSFFDSKDGREPTECGEIVIEGTYEMWPKGHPITNGKTHAVVRNSGDEIVQSWLTAGDVGTLVFSRRGHGQFFRFVNKLTRRLTIVISNDITVAGS